MTAVSTTAVGGLTRVTMAAVAAVAGGAAALAASVWATVLWVPFGGWFAVGALATYASAGAIVISRIGPYHPYARFGAANTVTLVRLIVTSLFAGLAAQTAFAQTSSDSAVIAPSTAWFFVGLAVLALMLDGFDGWLARRSNSASPFGARFDMETDALQILLLSIIAVTLGKVGAWVLLSGLLRYLYVAAGWIWPALAQPLPPSQMRKIICGIQSGALTALLTPIMVPPASTSIAAATLVLLIASFGRDVLWSVRNAAPHPSQG